MVDTSIGPAVNSEPCNDVRMPVSFINLSIVILPSAETLFLISLIVTFEELAIWPVLDTDTILFVLEPLTVLSVSVLVVSKAFSVAHVVIPLAFVGFTSHVRELSLSGSQAQVPFSFIYCAILEFHRSLTVAETLKKLSFVRSTCLFIMYFLKLEQAFDFLLVFGLE